jgi:DNA-directed RNA polymerase specialized sigma24 family protein
MNKIDELLKQYPYISEDIQKAQAKLNHYIALQQEARNPLRGQNMDGMPHGSGVSDQTYNQIERIMDLYQAEIDKLATKINELLDRKKWLDKAYTTLTEDERRILYLRYDERWQTWKIMQRLGIMKRDTFYKILDSAREKISKIMFT